MRGGNKKPEIFLFTRFSIHQYPSKFIEKYHPEIRNEADYLAYLYGDERLEAKFQAFERCTVPSIAAQRVLPTKWYIFTSPHLPANYKERLENAIARLDFAEIVYVNHFKDVRRQSDGLLPRDGRAYLTVNLDDDDALHPLLLEILRDAYEPGKVLSPVNGFMVSDYDFRTKKGMASKFQYKNNICASTGVGYSQGNYFALGNNHSKIHTRFPVVYIQEPGGLFIRFLGVQNHTSPKHSGPVAPFSFQEFLEDRGSASVLDAQALRPEGRSASVLDAQALRPEGRSAKQVKKRRLTRKRRDFR